MSSSSAVCTVLFLHLVALLAAMPTCNVKLNANQLTTAHHLLRDMAGPFPANCLSPQNNVVSDFPTDVFNTTEQCSRTSLVVYETLRKIHFLFLDEEELPVSYWDETNHDEFQNILFRMVDESCLKTKVVGSIPTLESFFSNLTTHLHTDTQVDRQCVWEGIRRELIDCLRFILHHFDSCLSKW